MSSYTRTTRECSFSGLRPDHVAAIRDYAVRYGLEAFESEILFCAETTSTREKRGLFGRKREVVYTSVVLTPRRLMWAVAVADDPPGVLAPRLRDIQVVDYESSPEYKIVPDTGLVVYGPFGGGQPGSAFIGLGPEPAGKRFRELLHAAVAEASS